MNKQIPHIIIPTRKKEKKKKKKKTLSDRPHLQPLAKWNSCKSAAYMNSDN
jgi:hypothetical protein